MWGVQHKNSRNIVEVKALWQLEVELNGGTLVTSFQGISGHNVNLKDRQETDHPPTRTRQAQKTLSLLATTAHGLPIHSAIQYKGDVAMMGDSLDLWSIKGSVSGIQFPRLTKIIQRLGQHLHK